MFADGFIVTSKKDGNLLTGQPHSLVLHTDINLRLPVGSLIDDKFTVILIYFVCHIFIMFLFLVLLPDDQMCDNVPVPLPNFRLLIDLIRFIFKES